MCLIYCVQWSYLTTHSAQLSRVQYIDLILDHITSYMYIIHKVRVYILGHHILCITVVTLSKVAEMFSEIVIVEIEIVVDT